MKVQMYHVRVRRGGSWIKAITTADEGVARKVASDIVDSEGVPVAIYLGSKKIWSL